jgi:hypothetical protein
MLSGYIINASINLNAGLINFLNTCIRELNDLEAFINISAKERRIG